jgi:hypothetical protein
MIFVNKLFSGTRRVLAECFNSMGIRVIPMASVSCVARASGGIEARLTDGHVIQVKKVLVFCPIN